jgi:NADH-quinone oxidoreductase subunit G
VNNEGRVQRFYQVFPGQGEVRSSERWLSDIEEAVKRMASDAADETPGIAEGRDEVSLVDTLSVELAAELPVFQLVPSLVPPASFRIQGMKIARQPQRYSGRTAMDAAQTVFEPKPPDDPESPLSFSMEGFQGPSPAPLLPRFWAPGWNSPQAVNRIQQGPDQPLPGGDGGRRLIEPAEITAVRYVFQPPPPFEAPVEGHLVVPAPRIFGSEELSMRSSDIAACAPEPFISLNADDARVLELKEGDLVEVRSAERRLTLPLRIVASLASGVAALPVGLPGLEGVLPPFPARLGPAGLERASAEGDRHV